jgi:lysozyme
VYGQSEYLKNPNIKAFLDTISQAEGTSGPDGYRTIFAGETFSDYSKHPDEVKCAYSNGQRLCSSAAGKYQFLKPTFDRLQKKLNLPDFSPQSQDLAAIELIREEGALEDIKAGKIKEALEKVSAIWVHIEGAGYGQPEHSFEKLEAIYQKHRQKYK